jgi:hypothetical protein
LLEFARLEVAHRVVRERGEGGAPTAFASRSHG